MKITKNGYEWSASPSTANEAKHLDWLFYALNELYATPVTPNLEDSVDSAQAKGQQVPQKTDAHTAFPPDESRPLSVAEAEKTFPKWFAQLSLEERQVTLYELDGVLRPKRRNQGYGSVPPALEDEKA